ncbi:YvrJ family protein [Evansella sp. AB-rgal1]|uniref:YvrJ family protein n=1 Tax=Evansella sp. AB-rgal1 TaxID=3242696 RepID=UPI00359D0B35
MEAWLTLVGEYGFPIVVTFYLLYRIEKKLDQLNQSVMYLGKLVQFGAHIGPASAPKVESGEWRTLEAKKTNY